MAVKRLNVGAVDAERERVGLRLIAPYILVRSHESRRCMNAVLGTVGPVFFLGVFCPFLKVGSHPHLHGSSRHRPRSKVVPQPKHAWTLVGSTTATERSAPILEEHGDRQCAMSEKGPATTISREWRMVTRTLSSKKMASLRHQPVQAWKGSQPSMPLRFAVPQHLYRQEPTYWLRHCE